MSAQVPGATMAHSQTALGIWTQQKQRKKQALLTAKHHHEDEERRLFEGLATVTDVGFAPLLCHCLNGGLFNALLM
jgi:hypothetical protein